MVTIVCAESAKCTRDQHCSIRETRKSDYLLLCDDFRPVPISRCDPSALESRRISVSKQAAAKTITVLVDRGNVVREMEPHDARRKRLRVAPLGFDVLRQGEAIFDDLRKMGAADRRLRTGDTREAVDDGSWRWSKSPGRTRVALARPRLKSGENF